MDEDATRQAIEQYGFIGFSIRSHGEPFTNLSHDCMDLIDELGGAPLTVDELACSCDEDANWKRVLNSLRVLEINGLAEPLRGAAQDQVWGLTELGEKPFIGPDEEEEAA